MLSYRPAGTDPVGYHEIKAGADCNGTIHILYHPDIWPLVEQKMKEEAPDST